ncbi:uncharacterized protein LOC128548625 [Mercenaria mercenaria]|uniref:uncharacterized protein LOC128548625 n=1 Tax=Mercenaria mercenaria TaxID=6596 RepID=UPI00234E3D07|nr:uncharacterized protein LOC128548625 [Mercenaria mercenaria]
MSYHSIEQEARSRRNNIIFYGITENLRYSDKEVAYRFMESDLDIDTSEMCIKRAHRLGVLHSVKNRYKDDPKRPLIVRFKDYVDTETVMEKAYKLRGSKIGVDRDYPREIALARKNLYTSSEAKNARQNKERMQIKYPARLFIKGKMVKDMFPDWFSILGYSTIDNKNHSIDARNQAYSIETDVDKSVNLIDTSEGNDEVFEPVLKPIDMYTSENANKRSRDNRLDQTYNIPEKQNVTKQSLPDKSPNKDSKSQSRGRNRHKS